MSDNPQITEAELEVMKVIWERFPISTNDIAAELESKSRWNVRTIHTLISRLEKKGAISHIKDGRVFIYSPVVNKEEYIRSESKTFLNKFYNGAVNKMIMNFMENDMFSAEDIEELKNILNKRK